MQRTLILTALLGATVVLGACGGRRGHGGGDDDDGPGGGSGLNRSDVVADLDEADLRTLCEWGADQQGGEGTVHDCGDGVTVTTQPVADCMEGLGGATCGITVGEVEDCIDAVSPDPCLLFADTPTDCLPMVECAQPDA